MNSTEQALHDKINLDRLVKRLEKSITDDESDEDVREESWIKAQGTLQKVKYARKLLKSAQMYSDVPPKTAQRYVEIGKTLDRVERCVLALEKRMAPNPTRPDPILPQIPLPTFSPEAPVNPLPTNTKSPETLLVAPTPLPTDDLLLSPTDVSAFSPLPSATPGLAFSPPTIPSYVAVSEDAVIAPKPKFLQNSTATQQELSDQLALMATQLKRNAMHFSESLVKDQAVVEAAREKIEGNYDVMLKERVRLRDHRGKSGSTTCLVMLSLVVVAISFIFMFFVIRVT